MIKKVKSKVKRAKRLSAGENQALLSASEFLKNLIPATAYGEKSFCWRSIAKNRNLNKYWSEKPNSASDRVFHLIKNVYQRHPRIFKSMITENLPRAVKMRHKKGNPVLVLELNDLNNELLRLNINISNAINELNLPTSRPAIVPPNHQLKVAINSLSLHPKLLPQCKNLFEDGYLNESGRKALEKYEKFVQEKSGLSMGGADLMAKTFKKENPLIRVTNEIKKERRDVIQDGFQKLSMGVMSYWRNYLSHGDEEQLPPQDVLAVLSTVSHLIYKIETKFKND